MNDRANRSQLPGRQRGDPRCQGGRGPNYLAAALTVTLICLSGAGQLQAGGEKAAAVKSETPTGSLVIVGGGSLPDGIRARFLELGGGVNARLVVIPTASKKTEPANIDKLNCWADWTPFHKAGKVKTLTFFHTRRAEEANDPAFIKPLTEASAVWFTGGDQSLLTAAYKGTAVERELRKVLARGGVVGGTSAGAAVMSEIMIRFGNPVAEVGAGFGLLQGVVVDQHFGERKRQDRLFGVVNNNPMYLGLGIDEQTGVVVQGQCLTVVGNRNVRVCLPGGDAKSVKIFGEGSRIDLTEMRRAGAGEGRQAGPRSRLDGRRGETGQGDAPA